MPRAGGRREQRRPNPSVQTAKVVVNRQGFEPARVSLRTGTRARITFLRTTPKTCGIDVVFPSLNIRRALPLTEAIAIEFTPSTTGERSCSRRLNDNAESTVVALMAEAGPTDATRTGDRTLFGGFVRIAYYRAGRSLT